MSANREQEATVNYITFIKLITIIKIAIKKVCWKMIFTILKVIKLWKFARENLRKIWPKNEQQEAAANQ